MDCKQCGSHNPDDAIFCNKCGKKIEMYQTSFNQQPSGQQNKNVKLSLVIAMVAAIGMVGAVLFMFLATKENQRDEMRNEEPSHIQIEE